LKIRAVVLLVFCASCAPAALDPNGGVAYYSGLGTSTAQAQVAQATAQPYTQEAAHSQFNQSLTATFVGPALTATQQANEYAALVAAQSRDNATATASVRATQNVVSMAAMLTAIPATGTALAVSQDREQSEMQSARSWSYAWGAITSTMSVLFLVIACAAGYWVWGRAQADVKRRKTMAENSKPHIFGNTLVLPSPTGGFTIHPIIVTHPASASLSAPVEIENRDIPINGGKSALSVSYPVNDHEREWRTALVQAAMVFQNMGFSSTEVCGKGKPFASASHWKDITDRLADNGLIIKDNGAPTLPVGQWGDIITRLQDANKPLRLPASRPPRLRVFSLENSV